MNYTYVKNLQRALKNEHIVIRAKKTNIVYEQGNPLTYKEEFSKLWMSHMNYISSIQTFPLPEVTQSIFNESLYKFTSKHSKVNLFVAKEEKEMIGFLQAGVAPNGIFGLVSDLHIIEKYRGMRIGTHLLKDCLDWFIQNEIKEVGLEVTGGNEKALAFYKRNGFNIEQYNLRMRIKKE